MPRASRNASSIRPVELRTEYLINPRGLDLEPRLSWELRALTHQARGSSQTAYQIHVAQDRTKLGLGNADLWNSGVVESAATTHIKYQGRPLQSRLRCYWRVRVRDECGNWSGWSRRASWTMGLLHGSDWSADWIGTGESFTCTYGSNDLARPDRAMIDPWFRKTLTLNEQPCRATAFVASVGYHELYINGCKVGDAILMPSVTDNSKRARYVSYEIDHLLRPGENVIGLWCGTGWSIFPSFATPDKPRAPIVLAQFDLDFPDGSRRRICTDASWKTHPGPSALLGAWYFMNFGGEHYDASREVPGWAEPGLDEAEWSPVKVYTPNLILSSEKVEPNRLLKELYPAAITEIESGVYRIDMGQNFAGWTEIHLQGDPGDRIEILFSERPDQPITHRLRSLYVVGPAGSGKFRNRFNYSSGRWITIRGGRKKPAATDIRGWLVRNDFAPAAGFDCSQSLLNQIYGTTVWTLENLTLGGYVVDCPQRERMGYGGDGHASITTALSTFGVGAFCTKWSEDWRDVQGRAASWGHNLPTTQDGGGALETGNVPYTAPTYWGGGGPIWSGFCVYLPWETYRRYGDREILSRNFDTIKGWLVFLESKAKGDLLQRWGGKWDFLGDWLWPDSRGVNGDTRETLFLNNCYWIYNLQIAAEIAEVLGDARQAASWRERACSIRTAVHAEFFNPADHSYASGAQAELAIALLAGVPPSNERTAVWKRLEEEILVVRGGHIHAGITGGAMLFKLLMDSRRDDLIYAMVSKQEFPSWGYMLQNDASTWWEAWRNPSSLLHSSFLYVGAWFIHGVLGIQPDPEESGFKKFVIYPGVIDQPELTWARGHYDSIHGRIGSAWERTNDRFELSVEVPPNSSCLVYLPNSDPSMVSESDRNLNKVPHVRVTGSQDNRLILAVPSGRYHFKSALQLTTTPLVPEEDTLYSPAGIS